MLFSLLLSYASMASAGCARRGEPKGGKLSIDMHGVQSPAQNQSSSSTSTITSSIVSPSTISSLTSSSVLAVSSVITTTSNSTSTSTSAGPSSASARAVAPAGKIAEKVQSTSGDPGSGSFTASFTHYSGCNSPVVACGFVSSKTGYTAAISQNFFGAAPGAGAGPGCSKCWQLSSSTAGTKAITVQVNNLCPSDGNAAMCAQSGLKGTNSVGTNINFDLCEDDGSSTAFFGGASVGMTIGIATEVAC